MYPRILRRITTSTKRKLPSSLYDDIDNLAMKLMKGNRAALSRGITLTESDAERHRTRDGDVAEIDHSQAAGRSPQGARRGLSQAIEACHSQLLNVGSRVLRTPQPDERERVRPPRQQQ